LAPRARRGTWDDYAGPPGARAGPGRRRRRGRSPARWSRHVSEAVQEERASTISSSTNRTADRRNSYPLPLCCPVPPSGSWWRVRLAVSGLTIQASARFIRVNLDPSSRAGSGWSGSSRRAERRPGPVPPGHQGTQRCTRGIVATINQVFADRRSVSPSLRDLSERRSVMHPAYQTEAPDARASETGRVPRLSRPLPLAELLRSERKARSAIRTAARRLGALERERGAALVES
jgi:hypothetical protein